MLLRSYGLQRHPARYLRGMELDALLHLLEEDARFRRAVREGIAQANRGEFIEEEEMDARLEQTLRS